MIGSILLRTGQSSPPSPRGRLDASSTRYRLLVFLLMALLCSGGLLVSESSLASAQKRKAARARSAAGARVKKPQQKPSPQVDRNGAERENEPVAEDGEDNPDGRLDWFMSQRMYPFKEIPDRARQRAWEAVIRGRSQGLSPAAVGTTWTSIGPAPSTSAFPNNGGFTAGRINAIAVSATDTSIVLIGTATGGIWRSINGGTTFTPVSDDQVDLAVGSIAFAPSDANIAYAGMGDLDNGYFGTGILKSVDAGATWTKINNATFPNKGNCTRIQVDPTNPNKVILTQYNFLDTSTGSAFISGIYLSVDGGVNWTKTLACLASDVVFHPTDPQIVYAGVLFAATSPGLYKSTNGGTNWTRVFTSPYTSSQGATRDFRVAVTPANANRVYVYFGTRTTDPFQVRLEMSDDAGQTWTDRGVICGACGLNNTMIDPGQFGYNTYLAASPTDANTIYVGSRDVFRSTDAGVTFVDLTNSFAAPWPNGAYTPTRQKFHADQQSFAFQPGSSSTFYAGNDGGLWKTTDGGASFVSLNSSLSLTQFVSIGVHPTEATRSYGGSQDNGTLRRTTGSGWTEFSSGDGGDLVIDPLDPSRIYTSYVRGQMSRFLANGTVYDGLIAKADSFGESLTSPRIAFYPPIVSNGTDSKVYAGTWRLFICSDCDDTNKNYPAGVTWTAPGGTTDLTFGGGDRLNAIAVARSDINIIYTGSSGGRAMRSTNAGVNWTDITTGLPSRVITSITVSPTDPSLLYLTVSSFGTGHVFKSTNSGTTWTDISNNLPNIPTSAFLIDPLTPATLYAGTDIGVFRSTDGGATWASFNNGLPPVPVLAFSAQASGLIQIGTYGRGAYELAPTNPTVQFSTANYNVAEGGISATVTVNRSGDTTGASTVDFLTSDSSATQAQDYVVASGTLNFAANETSKSFSVLIVNDAFVEANETLNVTLSNPVAAVVTAPSTATVTINDNDTAGATSPAPKRFAGTLDGLQETPANNSVAKGTGLVLLDAAETSAKVGLQFQNLGSAETAAHIHGAGAPGVMAPILFPLTPPIVNPITNFAISPTAQQVADLKANLHYLNVHSNNFLNGEIRGQLRWNPTLEENFFVRQQYLDFLSRDGDPGGFNFWLNQVGSCQADTQCFHDRTISTANAFFFEPEFQQTAGFVFRAYRAAFGNSQPFPNPDLSNPTEANKLIDYPTFVADRARVVGGADLAAAQQAFANLFVSRLAFTTKYALATTGPQFVDAVLATIQSADAVDLTGQRQALIDQYSNAGGGSDARRAMVLYRLAEDNPQNPVNNQAFINSEYNRQFALTLYFGYLRRNPDIGGFLFWQSQINLAPVRDVPKQNALVCSFITAAEYQLRFGANAPRTNAECPQ